MSKITVNHSQGENVISFIRFFAFALLVMGGLSGLVLFFQAGDMGGIAALWGAIIFINAGFICATLLALAYMAESLGYIAQNTPIVAPSSSRYQNAIGEEEGQRDGFPSAPEQDLDTKLAEAASQNDKDRCVELLAEGANPKAKSKTGFSAYDAARARSYNDLIKLFKSN